MNPIEKAVRRVDAVQQRHKVPAFAVGLVKKHGDDNGGVLVANLAHAGFVSLFPHSAIRSLMPSLTRSRSSAISSRAACRNCAAPASLA
jgi:hypothetical protein